MDVLYPNTLDNAAVRNIFVNQLSVLYTAKSHLIKSLPTFIKHANFGVLTLALSEEMDDANTQMNSLKAIFTALNETSLTDCSLGMSAIIKEALSQVTYNVGYKYESDMSIIFYMGVIENLQVGASRMLNLLALRPEFEQYKQLVSECLDMAYDNANLFHCVAEEYLHNRNSINAA